ncbi:LytR/AlgR family response regulator transcription factor [Dawidia soli]|uniref:Response regulator n=1 Tax=Dawidia soli TaxID=2782352 RepID=A0AAP2GD24_9BACT|nr:response regulator [Dawidia soli]MBT1686797.1 response regulator [Dawidia soli]
MPTKLRCILLDDELPALAYLRVLCGQVPGVEVVRAFNDPLKFLQESPALEFDLCILDIEMPGQNGLDVARQLTGKLVIFTTAYREYAAEAFDLDAIDYLRKPIQQDRFAKAIAKAITRLANAAPGRQYIQLNTSKGKGLLFFDQALYITTGLDKRDKVVLLDSGEEMLVKNMSFEKLLQALPDTGFCQINKKEIIAMKIVQFFTHDEITTTLTDTAGKPRRFSLSENFRPGFLRRTGG